MNTQFDILSLTKSSVFRFQSEKLNGIFILVGNVIADTQKKRCLQEVARVGTAFERYWRVSRSQFRWQIAIRISQHTSCNHLRATCRLVRSEFARLYLSRYILFISYSLFSTWSMVYVSAVDNAVFCPTHWCERFAVIDGAYVLIDLG